MAEPPRGVIGLHPPNSLTRSVTECRHSQGTESSSLLLQTTLLQLQETRKSASPGVMHRVLCRHPAEAQLHQMLWLLLPKMFPVLLLTLPCSSRVKSTLQDKLLCRMLEERSSPGSQGQLHSLVSPDLSPGLHQHKAIMVMQMVQRGSLPQSCREEGSPPSTVHSQNHA